MGRGHFPPPPPQAQASKNSPGRIELILEAMSNYSLTWRWINQVIHRAANVSESLVFPGLFTYIIAHLTYLNFTFGK